MTRRRRTTLFDYINKVLQRRPFCGCSRKEKDIYAAYCLRVAETVTDWFEDELNDFLERTVNKKV